LALIVLISSSVFRAPEPVDISTDTCILHVLFELRTSFNTSLRWKILSRLRGFNGTRIPDKVGSLDVLDCRGSRGWSWSDILSS